MPNLEPRTILIVSAGLCLLACLALALVAAERSSMERTLQEIRNLPEG